MFTPRFPPVCEIPIKPNSPGGLNEGYFCVNDVSKFSSKTSPKQTRVTLGTNDRGGTKCSGAGKQRNLTRGNNKTEAVYVPSWAEFG